MMNLSYQTSLLAMLKIQLTTRCWKITRSNLIPTPFPNGDLRLIVVRGILIRDFMTRARSRTRHYGEIMKAHCRIKNSAELTARAGATCLVCSARLLACPPACLASHEFRHYTGCLLVLTSLIILRLGWSAESMIATRTKYELRPLKSVESSSRFPHSLSFSLSFYVSLAWRTHPDHRR